MVFMSYFLWVLSYYRVYAELSSLALLAMPANPHFIELIHGLLHDFRVIG